MTTDLEAQQIVDALGVSPQVSLLTRAVARLETHYGDAWTGAGVGSNNWGAVTGSGDAGSFEHSDSRYDPDTGQVVSYVTRFRRYSSPTAGAADLVTVLKTGHSEAVSAAERGDWPDVSRALRDSHYYLGTAPREQAIDTHRIALRRALTGIASATGETYGWEDRPGGARPSRGSGLRGVSVVLSGMLVIIGLATLATRRHR